MADIELVIKIPEEVKNRLCFGVTYQKDIQTICKALNDGTPLPKGHDRLIEAKEAKSYLYRNMEWYDENGFIADDEEKDKALQDLVDGMPTFIEADKEGEEE